MPQFLLSPEGISGDTFRLSGPEAFHITRVLRVRVGETIELFDGRGGRYTGVIRAIHPDGGVEGAITGREASERASSVTLNLCLGLLKPSHWEWALEKGTELGVSSFTPVITPRTVVRLRDLGKSKESRWGNILAAASKQCRRAKLPELREPAHFRDAIIAAAKQELTLVAWERRSGGSTYAGLREVLLKARGRREKLTVNLFVGPEGGFSDEEIELAECEGGALFGLGPNTLRAETAAIAACSIIFYEMGAL